MMPSPGEIEAIGQARDTEHQFGRTLYFAIADCFRLEVIRLEDRP